ncbi:MAG: LysR family transcriptional regulator [Limnohabitans sp.]|nr:LysR family transcriptional regulator [Limnohabitans sp.]
MHSIQLHYTLHTEGLEPQGMVGHPLMQLLQAVADQGSISAAAKSLNLSYRHVWGQLKQWENELGHELIVWEKGQSARLTAFGHKFMWAERQTQARLAPQIQSLRADLERTFALAFDPQVHVLTLYASHDDALVKLQEQTASQGLYLDMRFCGSVDAIRALNEGRCVLAGFHTRETTTAKSITAKAYKPLLKPGLHKVIGFAKRQVGLVLPKGNPKGLKNLRDIATQQALFVHRAQGTGTRVLVEELLANEGMNLNYLKSFSHEEPSHAALAATIAAGHADVGMGIETCATAMGLDFVPLTQENYRLVCLKSELETPALKALRQFLSAQQWTSTVQNMAGYTPHNSGSIEPLSRALPWWSFS